MLVGHRGPLAAKGAEWGVSRAALLAPKSRRPATVSMLTWGGQTCRWWRHASQWRELAGRLGIAMANTTHSYLCIHGHFYQPPREDPFTGRIPHEPGASPYDNF